jgi:hypothetical protein
LKAWNQQIMLLNVLSVLRWFGEGLVLVLNPKLVWQWFKSSDEPIKKY